MSDDIPVSKTRRTVVGGKTAIKVGGKVLTYLAKKPFISPEKKVAAKRKLDQRNAKSIFEALVVLKGTALKIGQMLSYELDMVPPEIRKELEKSYNQVPPLNRALVRKVVTPVFGDSPERVFNSFNTSAFAAASLGQVHLAVTQRGEKIAVKVQYPGIGTTIKNDLRLLKRFVKPLPEARSMMPMFDEIEDRLLEEINYVQEAKNMVFFRENLLMENVVIPEIIPEYCYDTIISMTVLEGLSLDNWIRTNPNQRERDHVAGILNDIFLKSLYELNTVHADPNPGNFIIMDDLKVGLVDFGCVKKLDTASVGQYQAFCRVLGGSNPNKCLDLFRNINLVKEGIDSQTEQKMVELLNEIGQWYRQIYQDEYFDFKKNSQFILEGKQLFTKLIKYRKYLIGNPEILFLDRTRYGLFRLFEKLQASVKIRNPHECEV